VSLMSLDDPTDRKRIPPGGGMDNDRRDRSPPHVSRNLN
jgi:hypothetical protein